MLHVPNFSCFSSCKLFPPIYPSKICCTSLEESLIVSNGNHTRLIIVCTVFLRSTQTQANEKLLQREKNRNKGGVVGGKDSRMSAMGYINLKVIAVPCWHVQRGCFKVALKMTKTTPTQSWPNFAYATMVLLMQLLAF